jgi:hypothetical protein
MSKKNTENSSSRRFPFLSSEEEERCRSLDARWDQIMDFADILTGETQLPDDPPKIGD